MATHPRNTAKQPHADSVCTGATDNLVFLLSLHPAQARGSDQLTHAETDGKREKNQEIADKLKSLDPNKCIADDSSCWMGSFCEKRQDTTKS